MVLFSIVSSGFCFGFGVLLGLALGSAPPEALLMRSLKRIGDRCALFLMEVHGEAAYAHALSAADREHWRCDPAMESFWLNVADRVEALRPPARKDPTAV
jgi:hypothetical protein